MNEFETRARRRSADRVGRTREAVPRPATVSGALFYSAATLGAWMWRKLHRKPVSASPPWPFVAASRIIEAVSERRSWRRANRR